MDMSTPAARPAAAKAHVPVEFGPVCRDGRVSFRLWAPEQATIFLALEGREPLPMVREAGGWFTLTTAAAAGICYRFLLPDGSAVPDPASRFQPEDVHGPSEVVASDTFRWTDGGWRGLPWHEAVIYELHIGTFTAEGTFRAATGRLPYLKSLGISVVEVMPIGDFPGRWSWGYDGVLLFAPDSSYGRPDDFKAFVDRAHALGMAVLLDVVYNHFGPEGNYLPSLAPALTDRHVTPWGDAVDYRRRETTSMRDFVLANVRMWIGDFHLDGLRIDAAHEIRDEEADHVLAAVSEVARDAAGDRNIHLVLESVRLETERVSTVGGFDGQWNDDLHHALHAAITGEADKDYVDYADRPDVLARALAEGFVNCGKEGGPTASLPPTAFVSFLQNHDQVGNRARGERIRLLAPANACRAAAAAYLLAPQIPMLFQGEEWAADAPFPFFSDLSPAFATAVRDGRVTAFAVDPDDLLDPFDPATFAAARLDWSEHRLSRHARVLDWYRAILRVRRRYVVPLIAGIRHGGDWRVNDEGVIRITWQGEAKDLMLTLNLAARSARLPAPLSGKLIWQEGRVTEGRCPPWFVAWSVRRRGS